MEDLDFIEKNAENKELRTACYEKFKQITHILELNYKILKQKLIEDYKNVKTITLEDIEKSARTIELFMSTEVKPRKEYILENFDKIGGILE